MPHEVQSKPYWGLNILILVLVAVLLAVILIPRQIWNEEEQYRNESRSRMTNLWKVESVFRNLTGDYTELGSNAINVVNAVYDSLTDDVDYYGQQGLSLEPKRVTMVVDRVATLALFDSTLGDTPWDAHREELIQFYNTSVINDSTGSAQFAHRVLSMAYDSIRADTGWVAEQTISVPFDYQLEVPDNYVRLYDTTFVTETQIQELIQDTSYFATMISEQEMGLRDSTWIPKRDLSDMESRYPGLEVLDTSITTQTKWITESVPVRPNEEWLYDPLTGGKYIIRMSANGLHLTIRSPIEDEYSERRYYVFTLSDTSHGYIEDGEPSWESQ